MRAAAIRLFSGFSGFGSFGGISPSPLTVHALRTCATAMLALYCAYLFQLDSAFSAAVTVLIVAHPVHGMVWSKCFYRVLGTIIGALASILLAGLFAQSPEMYMLGFSLWVGACMVLATLIRNFRAYAALLAGYTVGLISLPGVALAPDTTFSLVVNRVSAILLGIFCSAVIGSLATRRGAAERLEQRMRQILSALVGHVRLGLSSRQRRSIDGERPKLRAGIAEIDSLVEFAAAESMARGPRVEESRAAAVAMFATLTDVAAVIDALGEEGGGGEVDLLIDDLLVELRLLDTELQAGERVDGQAALRERQEALSRLGRRFLDELASEDAARLRTLDRLSELVGDLQGALGALVPSLSGASQREPRYGYLAYHLDWRQAGLNGLRAMLSVWATGALWLASDWSAGGMMVGAVIPNVVMLSQRDRPDLDSLEFVKGTSLASLVVFFELLFILPNINGFPLLTMALGPVILVGIYAACQPSTAFMGLGFLVFFMTLMMPGNPMRYDMVGFLNMVPAVVGGALLTGVIHRVILPGDPRAQAKRLIRVILLDVIALSRGRRPVAPMVWESRVHDRLIRLAGRLRAAQINPEIWVRGGCAASRLGREIIRLRGLIEATDDLTPARRALSDMTAAWRRTGLDPDAAAAAADRTGVRLRALAQEAASDSAAKLMQASASLAEMAMLLRRERLFFGIGRRLAGRRPRRGGTFFNRGL